MIRVYTISHFHSDQGLHYLPFSALWSGSTLFAVLSKQHHKFYTVCHSELSDQDLHYLPFSSVWSGSTLFAILSNLSWLTLFPILSKQYYHDLHCLPFFRSSFIKVYTVCHFQLSNQCQQDDQGLHYLSFWAVCSGSPLLAIFSSLIKVYTICHSQQSDQCLHYLRFSAIWSTRFAILSLIRVYTICHSQSEKGLDCMPFSAVWSGSTLLAILSKQYYQGLHCFTFSAVWSRATLFAILSSLIRVYTICYSQHSDQFELFPFLAFWSGSTLLAILSSLIRVYTICHYQFIRVYTVFPSQSDQGLHCHSQQTDQGLHYLPFLAVWLKSRSTVILRNSLNSVYTICNSQQSDQGLHCLPFSAVWSGSTLFAILSNWSWYTLFPIFSKQYYHDLHCLTFFLSSFIKVYTVFHFQLSDQCLHYFPFTVWWVTVKNSNRSPRKFEHLEQYFEIDCFFLKLIEKSREYHKPQPTHDTKRKRKMTKAQHVKNKQTNAREAHRPASSSPSEVNTMLKGMTEHVLA